MMVPGCPSDRVKPYLTAFILIGIFGILFAWERFVPLRQPRVPLARSTSILGIVETPRRLYLLTDLAIAAPVFDGAGKVLGLTLQHFANGRLSGVVVLPAADIADMAKQAAIAQAAAPKTGG